ncbi:carboxymuconolactone decarboxylase family protein [Streptomyces sp. NPDC090445]|uniref:carboxymuconolactone decarboxylase family protein n=1 Tax=Streptomyces sp. NPDC090445 TaxID=3365963 RepID=UPI00381C69DE
MTTHEHTNEAGTAHAHEHTPRMNLAQQVPDIYRAVLNLEMATRKGMDPVLLELVKIRASQLNHCAFCLDMHTKDALAGGESVQRIVQLSAWEESRHFYTEKEIAAIELTEAVTVLTEGFVPDEVYEKAAKHFGEKELAQLIAVIATINVWNRLAVTTRMVPGHYTPGKHA